ncbi:FAD-binding oxidoreductase [Planktomarina temperata]|nr:FAD-binding oxidoreductase [Planktomarina temperata]
MVQRVLQSWGRLSADVHRVTTLDRISSEFPENIILPIGMGRSYGDVGLNPNGMVLDTTKQDHFISFNSETGVLIAEAGVTLSAIQENMVKRGWLLPVTPGTQYVTLGGAVSNDVHGKNHYGAGTFGCHLIHLVLMRSDIGIVTCSPEIHPDLFAATIGGMGLTGVILEVGIKLRPVSSSWLETETVVFSSIDEFFSLSHESKLHWEYSVAWIDCTNARNLRGLFYRANHCKSGKNSCRRRTLRLPLTPPVSLINQASLKVFNALYYRLQAYNLGPGKENFRSYFYPLDNFHNWNRLYGPKGFYQYQSVVPFDLAREATHEMLRVIADAQQGSFLMVLKTFGDVKSPGLLSFPMPGVTLAMDFPNRGTKTLQLFEKLDRIVVEANGRLYPAKDARMTAELFEQTYSNIREFTKFRDPRISSAMSRRIMGW